MWGLSPTDKHWDQTCEFCPSNIVHWLTKEMRCNVFKKWLFKKLIGNCKFITYPFWICKGWRSPIGNPSEVKNFSNSLASNNVFESRGPSLWPSNCSDERGNEPVLRK